MTLTRLSALDGEAIIPLADCKLHLRVTHNDEDTLIGTLRDAAIGHVERVSGVALKLPVNSVAPAITGTETVGQTLSLSNGTWTNTPDSYAYIWKRDGVVIAGETAATYLLDAADEGAVISASVVANNSGVKAVANSNSTGAIAAA